MKNLIIGLSILILTNSCTNSSKANDSNELQLKNSFLIENNMNIDTLKHYLKLQEKSPYVDDYDAFSEDEIHIAGVKDLELTIPFIEKGLIDNNYRRLDDTVFSAKIEKIFQNKIDKNKEIQLLMTPYLKTLSKERMDALKLYHFDSTNLFVSTKYNFIFFPSFLKDFVDIANDSLLIYKKVPNELIALNKYLFNGDKASLLVLAQTDSYSEDKGYLLRRLFYSFLYHDDSNINDIIFKDAKKNVHKDNPDTFEPFKYIFVKKEDSIYTDKQLINTITRLTSEDDCYYLNLFGFYVYDIVEGQIKNNYTEKEKTLILKVLIELEYPLREKYTEDGYKNDWGKYSFSSAVIANFPKIYENMKQMYGPDKELMNMASELIEEGNEAQ